MQNTTFSSSCVFICLRTLSGIYFQWRRNEFESGAHVRHKAPEFFWSCRSILFGFTSTFSRFDERFYDGQHSFFSFLFAVPLLTVPPPPCSAICKSGGHVSPCRNKKDDESFSSHLVKCENLPAKSDD